LIKISDFTSHPTQNRSFWRRSSQPSISGAVTAYHPRNCGQTFVGGTWSRALRGLHTTWPRVRSQSKNKHNHARPTPLTHSPSCGESRPSVIVRRVS